MKTVTIATTLYKTRQGRDDTVWYEFRATVDGIHYGVDAVTAGDKTSVFKIYREGGSTLRRDSALRPQIEAAVKSHLGDAGDVPREGSMMSWERFSNPSRHGFELLKRSTIYPLLVAKSDRYYVWAGRHRTGDRSYRSYHVTYSAVDRATKQDVRLPDTIQSDLNKVLKYLSGVQ